MAAAVTPAIGKRRSRPYAWLVPAVFAGCLVPLAVLLLRAARSDLGANPIAEALNRLGLLALLLLIGSLTCTPLKVLFGWTWPIRIRKTLGNFAFFYAALHLCTYAGLDQRLDLRAVLADVVERPFIAVGMLAFAMLVPLAATSTARMLKRLGAERWKRLHRLAYVAGALGVVHFFLRVKQDVTEPLIYGAVLALLFAVRIAAWYRKRVGAARMQRAVVP
jgi:sulfoxide reductase heme-binding subunit YedZ